MALLNQVIKGKVKKSHLVLIYGIDSVGKSTFGAQAPNPIFLGSEDGTNNLDVARFPKSVSTWEQFMEALAELAREKHEYKTLVIDSLDWIEPVLHKMICDRHGVLSIELASGGYGKGYTEALGEWHKFIRALSLLRDGKGMNVVLIAHSEVIKFNDPATQTEYDRFQLKLHKKASALFREYVDSVLFANFEVFSKKEGTKTRAYGDGVRMLYTERRPGFDAKNRFGIPFQIPLSWDDYERAVTSGKADEKSMLLSDIKALTNDLTDTELKIKVTETVEKAGNNVVQLEAIKNRLLVRLGNV